MVDFALTGGIASGKSVVSRMFREAGVGIVDADEIAREAVAPGTYCFVRIVQEFGNVLDADGGLDRKKLGGIVFNSERDLHRLNRIMLPIVLQRARERMAELKKSHEHVCFEAPTLIEHGLHKEFRPVVLVAAKQEDQVSRIIGRGFSREEALARIGAQLPLEKKVSAAHYVIENYGTLAELKEATKLMLAALKRGV